MSISFIFHLHEYINVEILENIDDYPFGMEDPNKGDSFYKSSKLYGDAMLHFTGSSLTIIFFLWIGLLKKKFLLIKIGTIILILDVIISNLIY